MWTPYVTGPLLSRAEKALERLSRALLASEAPEDPSLALGTSGLALAHGFLSGAFPERPHREAAQRLLDRSIEGCTSGPVSLGFHHGLTGVAYALDACRRKLFGEEADPAASIDKLVLRFLARPGSSGRMGFDLVSGLTGIGVYLAHRSTDPAFRPEATSALEVVVRRLEASAEPAQCGRVFRTEPTQLPPDMASEFSEGYFNYGLAHGTPGVLALLGVAGGYGITTPLLDDLSAHLASVVTTGESHMPAWVAPAGTLAPARTAWCYGDPGVAIAWMLAHPEAREGLGYQLARAALRRPQATRGIEDAGFCHGTAGLAHLFARLGVYTGDEAFLEGARGLVQETLDRLETQGDLVGGTICHTHSGPSRSLDLMTGAAGVALVLLAAVRPEEPEWDQALLLSRPRLPGPPKSEVVSR